MNSMECARRAWDWYTRSIDSGRPVAAFLHYVSWCEYCEEVLQDQGNRDKSATPQPQLKQQDGTQGKTSQDGGG